MHEPAQSALEATTFISRIIFRILAVIMKSAFIFFIAVYILIPMPSSADASGTYAYVFPPKGNFCNPEAVTVIGLPKKHKVNEKDTLLDIARDHDLGFNEIADLYPELDPWIPPIGMELSVPTQWVLPDTETDGIVINICELRLYYFMKKIRMVKTYPIGIGTEGRPTPIGTFSIKSKRIHPTWYVPPSLQEKYGFRTMPPGPDNPLGDYYMGLGNSDYGIHGTNFPWAVGRLVTHGCIRLYPEDIEQLFKSVQINTSVKIIYSPIKLGILNGRIYIEVHRDIYRRITDFAEYGQQLLEEKDLIGKVDMAKFQGALRLMDGLPKDITCSDP